MDKTFFKIDTIKRVGKSMTIFRRFYENGRRDVDVVYASDIYGNILKRIEIENICTANI